MRAIRLIVCCIYFLFAATLLSATVASVARLVRHHSYVDVLAVPGRMTRLMAGDAVCLALGLFFLTACLTYWTRAKSARGWGIAAGFLNALIAGGMLYVTLHYGSHFGARAAAELKVNAALLGIALLGLVAFLLWDAAAERKAAEGARTKLPGDGTHVLLDKLVWVVGLAGLVAAIFGWWRWARMEGLARHSGWHYYVQILIADLAVVLIHEMGHALTGKALGMRLRAFGIGPFQWRVREGRWRFELRPADLFAMGGSTGVVPTDPRQSRRREIWMILGGPLASLLGGAVGLAALLTAPRHAWSGSWEGLAVFVTFSVLTGTVNLLPFQTGKQHYSDGAQIYQLLSRGPWGDYHHAMGIVGAGAVTPLRPRDFDIAAMERASAVITGGVRAVHLRLLEYCYYLDCGRLREATQALNEAEAASQETTQEIPLEFYGNFVFGKAFVQRDAEGTRMWWKRVEAKKPKHFNADYWAARSAYLWMEGRMEDAREAWEQGNALARQLPEAGAYEFERDKFARLREELEAKRRIPRWHDDLAVVVR